MLGIVLKLLIVEKYLLARCKYELRAAVYTLENSICELHGRLPPTGNSTGIGAAIAELARPGSPFSFVPYNKGPDRTQISAV